MNRFISFLILVIGATPLHAQEVKINVNNAAIDVYRFSPRLELVLKKYAEAADWYWPASTLYKEYNENEELKRTEIIAQLNALQSDASDTQFKQQVGNLISEISSWKLAKHTQLSLDYDLLRINEKFNPTLEPGEYFLRLQKRPTQITVFGMVDRPSTIKHIGAADASYYIDSIARIENADRDYIYVIQPSGKIIKMGVAYWDNIHQEIPPGSAVYIPLQETPFSGIDELNQRIAELARNRLK